MPQAERLAEETSWRLGARAVPRGSVTRQKLSTCFGAFVREDETRRSVRTGSPVRAKSGGARRCLGPRRSQETVHAAWRSRPRLSGSTRGRSRDRGPTPVDTASRCAPLGKPAGRRGIRGTPTETRSEKNTLRDVRSAHRSGPVRHEPTAPHRVGTAVRRALRLGTIVLENRIREQQTSVEWTGVAAGPLPRGPEVPANALGAPRGEAS
jgi:hypothetical protein